MKRVLASTTNITYRVYFTDGNQRLLEGKNMYSVLSYLILEENIKVLSIWKIEEV